MYRFIVILLSLTLTILSSIQCLSYQRYDSTPLYPSSTINNLNNNNFPYNSVNYANDVASFPGTARYPNYSPGYGYTTNSPGYRPGYSTSSYNTLYGQGGLNNINYNPGYTSPRYGAGYGNSGSYGSNYGNSGSYGSNYGNSGSYGSNYGNSGSYGSNYGNRYGSTGSGYAAGYNNYGTSGLRRGYNTYESPMMGNLGSCENRGPQRDVLVENLMGMWYGVELIHHLGGYPRVDYTWTCIVIHLAEPHDRPSTEFMAVHAQQLNAQFRQQYRHLRLHWDEAGQAVEYPLYFRNDSAGYWQVFDRQNGSLARRPSYQQFAGTVQVLKAVNDHLLLTFCQDSGMDSRPAQLYSALFSREPGQLSPWEIDSVHNLLQAKGLSIASRRMVCGNSSTRLYYSVIYSMLTCIFACVLGSA